LKGWGRLQGCQRCRGLGQTKPHFLPGNFDLWITFSQVRAVKKIFVGLPTPI
jgi:hypothetical protein